MKKFVYCLLLILPLAAICQPVSSLDSLLAELNGQLESLNPEDPKFDGLITSIKALSEDIKSRKETAPEPNSVEGVKYWTDLALALWNGLPALLVTLITAFFGFIKRDPEQAVSAIQKAVSKIKTRWVIIAASVIASVVGMLFFREGAWSWPAAIYYLITSLLSGIGIAEVLDWINVKLLVKKKTA